jgi:hypothetical protein
MQKKKAAISCPFSTQGQKKKAAISCPFSTQGADAQLPACPVCLDSTQDAIQLPLGRELVTPNHNETTQNFGQNKIHKLSTSLTRAHTTELHHVRFL